MAYDEDLADRIRELIHDFDGVVQKAMFGGLAFLVDGNMAVAASGHGGLMVRVEPEQTESFLAEAHTGPMVMRGRAMDGWLRVEDSGITTDDQLRRWVEVGVARARALPAK